jgi:hypothetical protein
MDSYRGVDPGIASGDRHRGTQVLDAGSASHGQNIRQAGRTGTFDDLLAVSIEVGGVKMGMGINKELSD